MLTGASRLLISACNIAGPSISASIQAPTTVNAAVESKIRYIIDRHLLQSMGRLCTGLVAELIQTDSVRRDP